MKNLKNNYIGILILTVSLLFSLTSSANEEESKRVKKMYEQALSLKQKGKLRKSKKLLLKIIKNNGSIKLTKMDDQDVDAHGPADILNYGDFANWSLKRINLELKYGKNKIFKSARDLLGKIKNNLKDKNLKKLKSLAWVEIKFGPCQSHFSNVTDNEAVDYVKKELFGKDKKIKIEVYDSSLTVEIPEKNLYTFGLEKKGKSGWIWSKLTECSLPYRIK